MIALGCDHGGFELKEKLKDHLDKRNTKYFDYGCFDENSVDYPVIAEKVAKAVANGEYEFGILVCGTGIGMSLAANKVKGIRAAACSETFSAEYTRRHNDANILCLGGRVIGICTAEKMVDLFLDTPFEGGRHENRVNMIKNLEK